MSKYGYTMFSDQISVQISCLCLEVFVSPAHFILFYFSVLTFVQPHKFLTTTCYSFYTLLFLLSPPYIQTFLREENQILHPDKTTYKILFLCILPVKI